MEYLKYMAQISLPTRVAHYAIAPVNSSYNKLGKVIKYVQMKIYRICIFYPNSKQIAHMKYWNMDVIIRKKQFIEVNMGKLIQNHNCIFLLWISLFNLFEM